MKKTLIAVFCVLVFAFVALGVERPPQAPPVKAPPQAPPIGAKLGPAVQIVKPVAGVCICGPKCACTVNNACGSGGCPVKATPQPAYVWVRDQYGNWYYMPTTPTPVKP